MPRSETADTPTYTEPLDAIVLAGTDGNPRRMILGENKALLEIGGRTLVRRVVDALLEASGVGRIFVVGPAERLKVVLPADRPEITIVQQAGKMLANAWQAIYASEAQYRGRRGRDDPQRPMLFISSDLPLVSVVAIEDFVRRCAITDARNKENVAMMVGVAEETVLERYYAVAGRSGIRRPYVHMADSRLRLANVYIARPRLLAHQGFLQTGFEHRKAEQWKNVVGLAWRFLGQAGGWTAAWITLRLQATLLAARGGGRIYRWLRAGNSTARIERACGTVLGGSVRVVVTPYGGLSLDADNEDDFRVLSDRFAEWSCADALSSEAGR